MIYVIMIDSETHASYRNLERRKYILEEILSGKKK